MLIMARRMSAAEASLASVSECLALGKRLAARVTDTDTRGAQLAGKVCIEVLMIACLLW